MSGTSQLTMATLFDTLIQLDFNISLPVLLLALIGLLLVISGIKRCWQRRLLTGGLTGTFGLCLILLAGVVFLIALNIHTYQRFTYEKPIVKLEFRQLAPQQYGVMVTYLDDNRTEDFLLNGDEWQMDARVLRWTPPVQLLGLNTLYRLERLNGRYEDIQQEKNEPRTVYLLAQEQGLDLWSLAREYERWLKWMDAYYGNATYLPMQDGARYVVSITQYGLIARADNSPAKDAVNRWD